MRRAAILQNSVGVGGRSQVIAEAIAVLRDYTDEIRVQTLSGKEEIDRFRESYRINDDVQFDQYRGRLVPGTIYQQPILNWQARNQIRECDIVFNSNNCLRLLPAGPQYIHYVHFPIQAIPTVDRRYQSLHYRLAVLPVLTLLGVAQPDDTGRLLANSEFTRGYLRDEIGDHDIEILYPPCFESVVFNGFNGSGVVSVGAFHPNKRQLFQLNVAKAFPETRFRLVGSKSSPSYFRECAKYVDKYDLDNVDLLTDVSDRRLKELLEDSAVFLHSMENEHFGIATAEAMNQGCVPVVPDSGGQTEIVPFPAFRYTTREECVDILEDALAGRHPPVRAVKKTLARFSSPRFRRRLLSIVDNQTR
jgi:glycosyltransferase involved in cell wall biosynthesis